MNERAPSHVYFISFFFFFFFKFHTALQPRSNREGWKNGGGGGGEGGRWACGGGGGEESVTNTTTSAAERRTLKAPKLNSAAKRLTTVSIVKPIVTLTKGKHATDGTQLFPDSSETAAGFIWFLKRLPDGNFIPVTSTDRPLSGWPGKWAFFCLLQLCKGRAVLDV